MGQKTIVFISLVVVLIVNAIIWPTIRTWLIAQDFGQTTRFFIAFGFAHFTGFLGVVAGLKLFGKKEAK